MKREKYRIFELALIAFIAALAAFACGTPGTKLPVTMGTAVIGSDQVQELRVEIHDYYFKPSQINVVVNVPVRLIFKNKTLIVPHNFSIQAPDAGIEIVKDVGAGKTVNVEFTPTKTGEYQFFCDKDHHMKKGMVGTLVVKSQM